MQTTSLDIEFRVVVQPPLKAQPDGPTLGAFVEEIKCYIDARAREHGLYTGVSEQPFLEVTITEESR